MQRLIYGGYHEKQEIWFWCKNLGFTKTEQKIPNGIELYAVKPKISWIRYTCFWTDFSPGEFALFDHMHSF